MKSVALLFDPGFDFLGELLAHDGVFGCAVISSHGTECLGDSLDEWQVRGVPCNKNVDGSESTAIREFVRLRDPGFYSAALNWFAENDFCAVDTDQETADIWQNIQMLPFEPNVKHAILMSVKSANAKDRAAWIRAIGESANLVRNEMRPTSKKAVSKKKPSKKK